MSITFVFGMASGTSHIFQCWYDSGGCQPLPGWWWSVRYVRGRNMREGVDLVGMVHAWC